MTTDIGTLALRECLRQLRYKKALTEKAIAQVSDEQLHESPAGDDTIAVIMQHIAGNLRSRWTDFLTSDGEKPWRTRDAEFENQSLSRDQLMEAWEGGWACLFDALDPLTGDDLAREVFIRGQPHTVMGAIQRQVAHYAYHVGQIVMIARQHAGPAWQALTIPKGESAKYNARLEFDPEAPKR